MLDIKGTKLNVERYQKRMEQNMRFKTLLLEYVAGNTVYDIGAGTGDLAIQIKSKHPNKRVIAVDIDAGMVKAMRTKFDALGVNVEAALSDVTIGSFKDGDTYVFCSVLHEIYSSFKFSNSQMEQFLTPYFRDIKRGTRVIIRDGVFTMSGWDEYRILKLDNGHTMRLAMDFAEVFSKIVLNSSKAQIPMDYYVDINNMAIKGRKWFITEMMYTITWGRESFEREVTEWFTGISNKFYIDLAKRYGLRIIKNTQFLQAGYTENIEKNMTFCDVSGRKLRLPNSNQIVILEKM